MNTSSNSVELIDEDLPGAITQQLALDLRVIVEDGAGLTGDLNNDGFVDGADLAMLLGAWNTAKYDLDGDGIVSGSDLAVILGNWFSG